MLGGTVVVVVVVEVVEVVEVDVVVVVVVVVGAASMYVQSSARVAINVGVDRLPPKPFPSAPRSPIPQHHARPIRSTAHV